MDVRDVADGAIKACKFGRSGQCYILSNQFFTIRDFLNQIAEISGKKKISLVLPMGLALSLIHILLYLKHFPSPLFYFFATISILTHFYKLKINNEKFIFSLFLCYTVSSIKRRQKRCFRYWL